jgi:hypothetical protein
MINGIDEVLVDDFKGLELVEFLFNKSLDVGKFFEVSIAEGILGNIKLRRSSGRRGHGLLGGKNKGCAV